MEWLKKPFPRSPIQPTSLHHTKAVQKRSIDKEKANSILGLVTNVLVPKNNIPNLVKTIEQHS